MTKLGKIGKRNIAANKKIKTMFEDKGIRFCELRLKGCTPDYMLTFAHRHKRVWYRSQPELLFDYKQVILCCMHCHDTIERDSDMTAALFQLCRGKK
jgi:hypothetical protein